MKTYIVAGPVRGEISQHRTISGAYLSMRKDQNSCSSLGGGSYSDVEIIRADGETLSYSEREEIEDLRDREYQQQN